MGAQPKRSPAQTQAEAIADVERIAEDLYETQRRLSDGGWMPWSAMDWAVHESYKATVRNLLHRGVIRIGERPPVDPPLAGQTTIDDCA